MKMILWRGGIVSIVSFAAPVFAFAATLSVSPASGSFPVGSTITVTMQVNTQGGASDGVDVRYLNFNPSLLQVIDENTSVAGVQVVAGSLMANTPVNGADNTAGRITFSQVPLGGTTFTNSSAQTLATVRFSVVGAGTAALTFNHTAGSTADSNVAAGGSDLLTAVTNGSYTTTAANGAPIVSAISTNVADVDLSTPGIQYYEGTAVTYSGTASDPNGDPLTWTWLYTINGGLEITFLSGPSITPVQNAVFTYGAGTAGSTYRWILRASDGRATTQSTLDIGILAPLDTTGSVISNIASSNVTTTSATITWTTNEPADSQVEYGNTTSYGSFSSLSSTRVTSHSVTLTGLSPATTYNYRVISRDAASNPTTSLNRTFITQSLPDTTPPNSVTNLAASGVTTTSATVSWSAPSDLPGGGTVASYDIRYSTAPITELTFASATAVTGEPAPASPGTNQTYIVAGLNSGTRYYVALKSQDAQANVSLISNVITFTTQALADATPPTLSITSPTNGQTISGTVLISATAADNVGVVGVQFYLDGALLNAEDTISPYSASWNTLSTLDGSHILTARARDAAGNSMLSNGVTINLLNNPPPPFDFSLTNQGSSIVVQNSSVTNTITASLISGTASAVTFSISGLPAGATGAFMPASCSPGCSAVLTITTVGTTPIGTIPITASAIDGTITRTTSFSLTVNPPPSTKFRQNDNIAVRSADGLGVRVYNAAGTSNTLLVTQPDGTLGSIVGGPLFVNNAYWWQVNYNVSGGIGTDTDGWSTEDELAAAVFTSNLRLVPSAEGNAAVDKSFTISVVQRTSSTTLFSTTAQPNTQGELAFSTLLPNLLEGTYNLLIKSPAYLRHFMRDVVLSSSTALNLPRLRGGDMNNDGIINNFDWSFMNDRWFGADLTADLNRDGVINSIDYSFLNRNWGAVQD